MEEIWNDIPEFEYQISSLGRIRSLDKLVTKKNKWGGESIHIIRGKILKPWSKHHNYQCIYLCKNGKRNVRMIHRLVAQLFLGLDVGNKLIEVGHIDNDPMNNCVGNLYLTTHRDNEDYKMLCGRTTFGIRSTSAKLTEEQVLDIYKKYKSGIRISDLEKEYGHGGIREIVKGVNWKHLYHHF